MPGNTLSRCHHADDRSGLEREILRAAESNLIAEYTFRLRWPDATYRWMSVRAVAGEREADGEIVCYAAFHNVDELISTQRELRESKGSLTAAIEHSGLQFWQYYPHNHTAVLFAGISVHLELPSIMQNFPRSMAGIGGDGVVFAGFTGNLVEFIQVDDAVLRLFDVLVRRIVEIAYRHLHIGAHEARLGEAGGVRDGKGDIQQSGEVLEQGCFAAARGTQHGAALPGHPGCAGAPAGYGNPGTGGDGPAEGRRGRGTESADRCRYRYGIRGHLSVPAPLPAPAPGCDRGYFPGCVGGGPGKRGRFGAGRAG